MLDLHSFATIAQARTAADEWRQQYNDIRPPVLCFPGADGVGVDAVAAAQFACWRAGVQLFENGDNLRFAEATLAHG